MVQYISPIESWKILENDKLSYLIDIRTEPETIFAGRPDLSICRKEVIEIPWLLFPSMSNNKSFLKILNLYIKDKDAILLLLCKDGSLASIVSKTLRELNYKNCHVVKNGFNGGLDEQQKKRMINGWKADNLPWLEY